MPEPLLNVLKICLLALLYLFFLRVLRAVWAEVHLANAAGTGTAEPPAAAPTRDRARGRRAREQALHAIEPAALAGRVFNLGDEITVGRAAGCQISLDDTFVSQIHARVFRRNGTVFVEDLGSTNGTFVNGTKLTEATRLTAKDRLQVGSVVLELR